jgi:ABC-type lipoprotein release transport system permease subunit
MEGLRTVALYVDEMTLEEEETLLRQLTAISRRSENYSVQNHVEQFRRSEERNRQTFLLFFSVLTVFFTVSVGMIVSSVTRQLHSQGRTIGMLRAVGADEKAILGCYSGQIQSAVWGGLALSGSLFGAIQLINILNMPTRLLRNLMETGLILGTMIVLTLLCGLVCRLILRLRIREIVNKSIIDNIREL